MVTTDLSRRCTGIVLFLLFISVAPALSTAEQAHQKDYALIFGTVWAADNRPAYGITVKIRRANEKKARWELMSDHSGEFAQRLPVGKQDYIVWADIKTGKGKAKPERSVHIENNERVDISLHLTE